MSATIAIITYKFSHSRCATRNDFFFLRHRKGKFSIARIAASSCDETLLASRLIRRWTSAERPRRDAGEETRGAGERKREENERRRGLFASECKPRLSALRSRASVSARIHVCTHACTVCVRRVCTRRVKTPGEGSREVPPSPSRETTPRRRDFACECASAQSPEKFAARFPKERRAFVSRDPH